jgi:hypothetical protein
LLDGLGGGVGDSDPDGHLVLVGPVEDLYVQGGALRRIEPDGLIEIVANWGTFRKQAD